jgi:ribosomal protein L11 methyltransferase
MKFKKVIAQFDAPDLILAEELICDIFFSFNLKGVVCDVPLDEPDEGFGTNTLPIPEVCSIIGFLPLVDSSKIILEKIKEKSQRLMDFDIKVDIITTIVDEKDWADAWKAYFDVTPITDRITIKPEWKDHEPKKGEIVIHLDPGMAFGTGTHPTTAMCIKMIDDYLEPDATFLDIGTGSGILMVAAAKLGAKRMTGIDNDEIAVHVARKNLDKNNIDPGMYDLICTILEKIEPVKYDFIAANIIAQVIVEIMPQIARRMDNNTTIVLSGIIRERQNDVQKALIANDLFIAHQNFIDEWVCLAVKKAKP